MKHIQKILTASAPGLLSMEEIEEQIEAAEPVAEAVDVVAETPALGEEPSDPLDVEAEELDADVEDFDESVDELETGADVAEKLEDTVQVMESLLDQVGAVSLVEYTSMSEFASTQMARLGVEFGGFSSEGIDDPAARLENLRLSTEAIKQQAADVKKATAAAAKKIEDHSASLWDKLLALLGNQTKRLKVLLDKVDKAGDQTREQVKIGSAVMGYVSGEDGVATAKAVNKACTFFYGQFFVELREWSARRTETIPTIPAGVLSGLPGNPVITLNEKSAEFDHNKISAPAAVVKVLSKGEIKQLLNSIKGVIEDVRKAGEKWMSFRDQLIEIIGGGAARRLPGGAVINNLMKLFSRGHRCVSMVFSAYNYFTAVIGGLLKYAGYHIAAYK